MREFSVAADLDLSAHTFFLERDSVAFRCLLGQVQNLPWKPIYRLVI